MTLGLEVAIFVGWLFLLVLSAKVRKNGADNDFDELVAQVEPRNYFYGGLALHLLAMPLVRAHATRALDIDPSLPDGHAMLGLVASLYDYDWEEARRRFEKAMAADPVPRFWRTATPAPRSTRPVPMASARAESGSGSAEVKPLLATGGLALGGDLLPAWWLDFHLGAGAAHEAPAAGSALHGVHGHPGHHQCFEVPAGGALGDLQLLGDLRRCHLPAPLQQQQDGHEAVDSHTDNTATQTGRDVTGFGRQDGDMTSPTPATHDLIDPSGGQGCGAGSPTAA